MSRFAWAALAAAALLCLYTATAQASVIVQGTRVIFPAGQGETTVQLTNDGDKPQVVQSWIDTGNPKSTPDTVNTPFLITPPVFRMEPHTGQSLRIAYVQGAQTLPRDRETVFWLNVLAIPPKPGERFKGKNTLQVAIRTRLKLFYRPPDLPGSVLEAPGKLTFQAAGNPSDPALQVHNPTPYYITIMSVARSKKKPSFLAKPGMVAPFESLRLSLKGSAPSRGDSIVFTTLNDFGAATVHKGQIE